MLNSDLKSRLAKIYELVKRGTDGEQAAAQRKLDAFIEKYNLQGIDLDSLDKEYYFFKYSTALELLLMSVLIRCLIDDQDALASARRQTRGVKQLKLQLRYLDYVTINCAYEYFRRHMKEQWNKLCAPELQKKRKTKTRNERREQLQELFFDNYIIKSGLYKPGDLSELKVNSKKEYEDRMRLRNVEGGSYTTQVQTGLMIGDGTNA